MDLSIKQRTEASVLTKRILIIALLIMLCASAMADHIKIDAEHFPDKNFRAQLQKLYDEDGDGFLSDAEQAQVGHLYLDNCNIASVEGIEYLTGLATLVVCGNKITEIDLSGNPNLSALDIAGNPIVSVDISSCPDIVEHVKKGIIYRDENSVHWNNIDLNVDAKTTVRNGDKILYHPDMLPFIHINAFEVLFEDIELSKYAADITIKEATTYADGSLTLPVGTIPAYTAILIDAIDVTGDHDVNWTIDDGAYPNTKACKVVNYGDASVFVDSSALWGSMKINPDWTYTTFPKGTILYQRPDIGSASVELEKDTKVAIIKEKDGWCLIRANKKDLDPYFFVPVE